jgi:[protein-PII] uridylyltransferase
MTVDPLDLPVVDPGEIESFVGSLPLAVDRAGLSRFLLGFPRHYLERTPRAEIVKHYVLMQGLRARPVTSALSRQEGLWKLEVMCRDRRFLFSRIAGSLSFHGLDIVGAEAFANRSALVLDTFLFADPEGALVPDGRRRDLQAFLERAVEGAVDLEMLLEPRLRTARGGGASRLGVVFDDDAHPSATRLSVAGPDFVGLLYLVSRAISEAGCDIAQAHVRTPAGRAHDEFYVTRDGARLGEEGRRILEARLLQIEATLGARTA